jgi:hypothetical protein
MPEQQMPEQQKNIDPACLTTILDCLYSPEVNSSGRWVQGAALSITAQLITIPNLGVSPSFGDKLPSVGPYSTLETKLILPTCAISEDIRKAANDKAKEWFSKPENHDPFKKAFEEVIIAEDFKSWLHHERQFIWHNHAASTRSLFNKSLIPELAILLDRKKAELEYHWKQSTDLKEVDRLIRLQAGDDYKLLSNAYVGAFFLRTIRNDYEASLNKHIIRHHPLRGRSEFLPLRVADHTDEVRYNEATRLLAWLICECAREEKEASDNRPVAYTQYVQKARQEWAYFGEKDQDRENQTQDAAIDAAAKFAVHIGMHSRPADSYNRLKDGVRIVTGLAGLGGGIGLASVLTPFLPPTIPGIVESIAGLVAGAIVSKLSEDKNLAHKASNTMWDNEKHFKEMLRQAPPGRLGANWD